MLGQLHTEFLWLCGALVLVLLLLVEVCLTVGVVPLPLLARALISTGRDGNASVLRRASSKVTQILCGRGGRDGKHCTVGVAPSLQGLDGRALPFHPRTAPREGVRRRRLHPQRRQEQVASDDDGLGSFEKIPPQAYRLPRGCDQPFKTETRLFESLKVLNFLVSVS